MSRKFSIGDIVAAGKIVAIPENRPGFYIVECDTCGFTRIKQANKSGCRQCNKRSRKLKRHSVGDITRAGKIVGDSDSAGKYLIECIECNYVRRIAATNKSCPSCYSKNKIKYYPGKVVNGTTILDVDRTESNHTKFLVNCPQCRGEVWKPLSSLNKVCYKCKSFNLSLKLHSKTIVAKIGSYKTSAKKRGYSWELSNDLAQELFEKKCYYCGQPPTPLNGIDRVNNNYGYTVDNSVPCCKKCNYAKNDMSLDEWYDWLNRIASYRGNLTKG